MNTINSLLTSGGQMSAVRALRALHCLADCLLPTVLSVLT